MSRPTLKSLVFFCAIMVGGTVQAEQADTTAADFSPQVWLNPGLYSMHFNRNSDFRENNIGFGAEVLLTNDHSLMGGSFINSDRQRSYYGLYQWRPMHWEVFSTKVSAGIAAGVFDGYPKYKNGAWFAAALPLLSVEGERFGVNFAFIPTIPHRMSGAVAIQVKLRVW
ncbi:MAG: hypothetical protein WAO76_06185 [Georgfuchsia sp.]